MKINNDRAAGIAIALPGLNVLQYMTPVLLSIDQFLYGLSTFGAKMEKIYRLDVWIVFENAPSNSAFFSSSFHCAAVSNASCRVTFYENVANVWNY